jgi:hypothetical protein
MSGFDFRQAQVFEAHASRLQAANADPPAKVVHDRAQVLDERSLFRLDLRHQPVVIGLAAAWRARWQRRPRPRVSTELPPQTRYAMHSGRPPLQMTTGAFQMQAPTTGKLRQVNVSAAPSAAQTLKPGTADTQAWARPTPRGSEFRRRKDWVRENDFRDAEAIAEAVQRPTMKFVATKTSDQLAAGLAPRPRALGQSADRHHQSDPCHNRFFPTKDMHLKVS